VSESVVLETAGLQVAFFRHHDRYAHRVALLTAAGPVVLLESLEGTDADRWPTSPPLQELHVEDRPRGGKVALLVGMAGASHWSLSCELDPAARRVTFEAACRIREASERLGSGYRLGPGIKRVADTLQTARGGCALGTDARIEENRDLLRFLPDAADESLPRTVTWSYGFSPL
jgi:hypothetical protein